MVTTRVTSKGQVVIPAAIRRRLGISKGTPLVVEVQDDAIIMRPATRELFDELAGLFEGGPSMAKELVQEHARDREREDQ